MRLGINQALGPTVEWHEDKDDTQGNGDGWKFLNRPAKQTALDATAIINAFNTYGVVTTMKHFPYTPDHWNLHDDSKDTLLSEEEVGRRLQNFKLISGKSDFVMSTHLFNSKIDPDDLATFSSKWISILRKDIGFEGILMTDGIHMISEYPETLKKMTSRWNPKEKIKIKNEDSIFAARAILSGHDMIFLETVSADTLRIFKDVHYLACQGTTTGKQLRSRIEESFVRVKAFKEKNESVLRDRRYISADLVKEANNAYEKLKVSPGCKDHALYDAVMSKIEAISKGAPVTSR